MGVFPLWGVSIKRVQRHVNVGNEGCEFRVISQVCVGSTTAMGIKIENDHPLPFMCCHECSDGQRVDGAITRASVRGGMVQPARERSRDELTGLDLPQCAEDASCGVHHHVIQRRVPSQAVT